MSAPSHDEIELRIASALTGEGALDAELRAHLATCRRCGASADALRGLREDVESGEPDAARWARFDEALQARLPDYRAARTASRWRRRTLVALPLAAALLALAVLVLLRHAPGGPTAIAGTTSGAGTGATAPVAADPSSLLAEASTQSIEMGLSDLGLSSWDQPAETSAEMSPEAAALTAAPAWGDVLAPLEEELAPLSASEQEQLARTLREAS
jgi:hypothetical protein